MHTKDHFELKEGVRYNLGAGSYVARITNRKTGANAQFIMDKNLDQDFGKFIKSTEASQLSWVSRNGDKNKSGIVIFNIPDKKIAYKIVFDLDHKDLDEGKFSRRIIKAFSSIEEGKWTVEKSLPKDVKEKFETELERLEWYLQGSPHESPGIFR